MQQVYYVAAIDVHKAMLAVVVAAVEPGEWRFQRRKFGATRAQLRELARWLDSLGVQEAVMESTAQYWRPVWLELEGQCQLHLAQAHSNRARRGRKSDFQDAERLLRRHVAGELVLSFVPDREQRAWRWLTRTRYQLITERMRVQSHIEGLLEDAQIKLSSLISDLLGVSGRRILEAMAAPGQQFDAGKLAELGHGKLRASKAELRDALDGRWEQSHRFLLRIHLERVHVLDEQIERVSLEISERMSGCQEPVKRLCEVPGVRTEAALQMVAEVGAGAEEFPSAGHLASWVGVCPGQNESAERNRSGRSAKGNWQMRRLLSQSAHAAARTKGSYFQGLYRRLIPRLGAQKAIWAVAHRLCRVIWKILHTGERYREMGDLANNPALVRRRQRRIAAEFRRLGYQVQFQPISSS